MKLNNRVRFVLIGIVTFVWCFNFFAAAFDPHYHSSAEVDAPFMAVVGYLLAGIKNEKDDDEPKTKDKEEKKKRVGGG